MEPLFLDSVRKLLMTDKCTQCGNTYEQVGIHWSQSSCSYPNFSKHQREIITGLVMGDGYVDNSGNNPYLNVKMISPNYLKYIDSQFKIFGNGVRLSITAEESAKQNRDNGFSPNAKAENYSDKYRWQSMRHPELKEFREWYSTGNKIWPANIELTPTVLKHWYCGDGCWDNTGGNNRITIAISNESENTEKINSIFKNVGLPCPKRYKKYKRDSGSVKCDAVFTVDQSKKLWEYMGEPLPDFEYKWPEEYK